MTALFLLNSTTKGVICFHPGYLENTTCDINKSTHGVSLIAISTQEFHDIRFQCSDL